MRGVGGYARERSWAPPRGTNLYGANVTILGGGGITEALIELLQPFKSRITVVRNHVQEMRGVDEVVEAAGSDSAVADQLFDELAVACRRVELARRQHRRQAVFIERFQMRTNRRFIAFVPRRSQPFA